MGCAFRNSHEPQIEFEICIRRNLIFGEVEVWAFGRLPWLVEASDGFSVHVMDVTLGTVGRGPGVQSC